ncbi:hypothetical protein MTR67_015236 [Solanum verrucosum]|uniref:Uncharacterized protein n=1 Tax=Solanum verrucosum TaxID=315347 RepID=A0AAF0QJL7_SOLVR|nr:hypothetical protein MTR67_015236 [Solanum verrucosum]
MIFSFSNRESNVGLALTDDESYGGTQQQQDKAPSYTRIKQEKFKNSVSGKNGFRKVGLNFVEKNDDVLQFIELFNMYISSYEQPP